MDLREFFKNDRFAAGIGAELTEVGDGFAKAKMLVTAEHVNATGYCQGGALFTLADLAFAAAVNSHEQVTVAISSTITYVSNVKGGWVYAEAREVVNHRRTPFCEVRITSEEGKLLAILTASGYRKNMQLSEL